jgi:acetoin utilization protein AcuB
MLYLENLEPAEGGRKMYVRDIMTTKVITIPSKTHVIEAKRIMQAKNIRRLPVVDGGKLVGLVTQYALEKAVPVKGTYDSIWDLSYSLLSVYRTPVAQIMRRDVVTARPDMTVEEAPAGEDHQ